jgi:hypothetical protein
VQLFYHIEKTHNDIVSTGSLTTRQHTTDLNYKSICWCYTYSEWRVTF